MITEHYKELIPAYGRDYKTQPEVVKAFKDGKDFEGDFSLGFKLCSIRDFAKGTKVLLRYGKKMKVATTEA